MAASRGWLALQRGRVARRRHPELGEVSAFCFYATRLRFRDLAFDIGANHGSHTKQMVNRGARVVAIEPQAGLARNLAERFPTATILRAAVSDEPGEATLHLAGEGDLVASLDATWVDRCPVPFHWAGAERVPVVTIDGLIATYGVPDVIKIDAEGLDHQVLSGLSQPISHLLFEVTATPSEAAAAALEHVERLGDYELYMAELETWRFQRVRTPDDILNELARAPMLDIYARSTTA